MKKLPRELETQNANSIIPQEAREAFFLLIPEIMLLYSSCSHQNIPTGILTCAHFAFTKTYLKTTGVMDQPNQYQPTCTNFYKDVPRPQT